MIIAQLTDLHIGFAGKTAFCKNSARLRQVLTELKSMTRQPDLLLITGDLVEIGAHWAYDKLRRELKQIDLPCYFAMGNHDDRSAFAEAFPNAEFNGGFLQYVIEDPSLRIIVLDTLEPGRHGGAFCSGRAAWLETELAKHPARPTLIALHHPPIETGIAWMTARDDDGWVLRLKNIIARYDNVVQVISGHIHRPIFKRFAETNLSVSPAIAPQIKLDLAKIDPDASDNRVLLIDTAANYSLHCWDGTQITTHNGHAPDGRPIIRYDKQHAHVIRQTMDMPPRPGG